jgi:hypothetical protein
MRFVQTIKHLKNGGFATRTSMEKGCVIGLASSDEGQKDEPIKNYKELTVLSYFVIYSDNEWQPFCPYLQDVEANDWIIVEN